MDGLTKSVSAVSSFADQAIKVASLSCLSDDSELTTPLAWLGLGNRSLSYVDLPTACLCAYPNL